MFNIAPDHAIGLYFGLLALPLALIAIRLRPARHLVPGTVLAYLGYIALGFDSPDQVAVATKLLELTALGFVLVPVRGESRRRTRRWASLGVALPALTLITASTVWIVDLARPADAQHAHAGALLQATNEVAT